jgi:hypothetical protein
VVVTISSRRWFAFMAGVLLLCAMLGRQAFAVRAIPLAGAVYSEQIPVYPDAALQASTGGLYSASLFGPPSVDSRCWWFYIQDPANRVVDFYRDQLPGARITTDGGETVFHIVPQGARPGESVTIRVRPGEVRITETVRPGRRLM